MTRQSAIYGSGVEDYTTISKSDEVGGYYPAVDNQHILVKTWDTTAYEYKSSGDFVGWVATADYTTQFNLHIEKNGSNDSGTYGTHVISNGLAHPERWQTDGNVSLQIETLYMGLQKTSQTTNPTRESDIYYCWKIWYTSSWQCQFYVNNSLQNTKTLSAAEMISFNPAFQLEVFTNGTVTMTVGANSAGPYASSGSDLRSAFAAIRFNQKVFNFLMFEQESAPVVNDVNVRLPVTDSAKINRVFITDAWGDNSAKKTKVYPQSGDVIGYDQTLVSYGNTDYTAWTKLFISPIGETDWIMVDVEGDL